MQHSPVSALRQQLACSSPVAQPHLPDHRVVQQRRSVGVQACRAARADAAVVLRRVRGTGGNRGLRVSHSLDLHTAQPGHVGLLW